MILLQLLAIVLKQQILRVRLFGLPISGSPGAYRISDAAFGLWQACYGDPWVGTVRISDACGKLTMSGTDSFGDSYSMTVTSTDANNIKFDWINTYGENGSVTIKSNAGKPWPAGLR